MSWENTIRKNFGSESYIYNKFKKTVKQLAYKRDDDILTLRDTMGDVSTDVLIDYMYLTLLSRIIVSVSLLKEHKDSHKLKGEYLNVDQIDKLVSREFYQTKGITNYVEEDDPIERLILNTQLSQKLAPIMLTLGRKIWGIDIFSRYSHDLLGKLYETMIHKKQRKLSGEYYTPNWLASLIITKSIGMLEELSIGDLPTVLDPACGSGTFLVHSINILSKRTLDLKEILNSVIGFDINPMAVTISKTNYILALLRLGLIPTEELEINIPVYNVDAVFFEPSLTFDLVVGNPPWVTLRDIKNLDYQEAIKTKAFEENILSPRDVHLFTQIDLSTIFAFKYAKYLSKNGGIISFIMPKRFMIDYLYNPAFRERFPVNVYKFVDLEGVKYLFNVPSCIFWGTNTTKENIDSIAVEEWSGKLYERDPNLDIIEQIISKKTRILQPVTYTKTKSYYYSKFKTGASIFPRTLYFVDIIMKDNNLVFVETSHEIYESGSKEPWKVKMSGQIEENFIFSTIIGNEIIPFGYMKTRAVVLPVIILDDRYKILDVPELKKNGFIHMAKWLEIAQRIWEERSTPKSKKRFYRLVQRLNYNNLLETQNPSKRYVVIYNATGSNITSCVIDRKNLQQFKVKSSNDKVPASNFVADVKTWIYETNNRDEAYYLTAILNSSYLNSLIKPLQPRGIGGPRAIHRRPLLFPIPKFNDKNPLHKQLSHLGFSATRKVHQFLNDHTSDKISRKQIKEKVLAEEMIEIDKLTQELLSKF